jgi:hypothetical protein
MNSRYQQKERWQSELVNVARIPTVEEVLQDHQIVAMKNPPGSGRLLISLLHQRAARDMIPKYRLSNDHPPKMEYGYVQSVLIEWTSERMNLNILSNF